MTLSISLGELLTLIALLVAFAAFAIRFEHRITRVETWLEQHVSLPFAAAHPEAKPANPKREG